MKIITILLTTLLTQMAVAGDAAYYTSLGFSKNGNYYAYLQEGVYDGLGAFWIELGIIDVKANKYVGREKMGGEDELGNITTEADRPKMLKAMKKKLYFKAYGFSKKPRQEVKVYRPQFDLSTYTDTLFSLEYWAQGGASAAVQRFHLLLDEVSAPVTQHNEWCDGWYGANSMIELRLHANDSYHGPGFKKDLQIDSNQPEVRACAFDYQIRYVFVHEDSLSTVIRFRRPGFEGPDERFMVVTGNIFK